LAENKRSTMLDAVNINDRLATLESRIHKLIELHESLKSSCRDLLAENHQLVLQLEEERTKSKRLEEGYRNLKEQEMASNQLQVDRINIRINELVSEIDKSIKLMDV
jgi:regulator of replication initiation timing